MRILWMSNAPWVGSGYGEQTAMFVPRLQALGHDVGIAANHGLQGAKFPFGDVPVYPASANWGNLVIGSFAKDFDADFVIALCDAWVMNPEVWPDDLRMAIWAPIDHYPIPPAVLKTLQHPKVTPIAMSRFGEKWMRDFELDPLYVPHGVDTELFRPIPGMREKMREALGVPPDAFLIGMVAANNGWNTQVARKSFPQAFHAFAHFARERPDAWLYVHTKAISDNPAAMNLDILCRALGALEGMPLDRVRFPPLDAWDIGMPRQYLANLYQAFDVLLNPSMSEGFGIPILEAQACGIPVITSDHSAMPELTNSGWSVQGDPWWDALQESFAFMPSIASIEDALHGSYHSHAIGEPSRILRERAVKFAQQYDADVVTETYWKPALEALSKPREVAPLKGETRQVRRAKARQAAK